MATSANSMGNRFKALNFLFVVSLLLASFDIALDIEIGGVSIRGAQFAQLLFVSLYFFVPGNESRNARFRAPVGFKWLLIWGGFLAIWTPNTYHLAFSIGYTLFFMFSITIIFVAVQVYSDYPDRVVTLFRTYINSFVLVALFGLIQFVGGLFGYDLLVTQWWREGVLPRLNGFSFEPSYYATYLITGWGMLAWLVDRKCYVFRKTILYAYFGTVSLAIFLSSSRMAILIMAFYLVYYFFKEIAIIVFRFQLRTGFLKVIALLALVTIGVFAMIVVTVGFDSLRFLLFGTGIAGSADHSSAMRLGQFEDTLHLFLESPIVGYGLGGLWSHIAMLRGIDLSEATGMNVTAEVLASSGIFGFFFYLLYLFLNVRGSFRFLNRRSPMTELLAAAGMGFLLLYLILQFNQSIMRVYFWNHLAVLAVLYECVRQRVAARGRTTQLLAYRPIPA